MIEYALIAVLVILGIVFMGPYALRSVNAHFKMWDEGVQDSSKELITQAPIGDVPFINATCTCSTSTSCGSPTGLCAAYQLEEDYSCTPVGCNGSAGASKCIPDTTNTCCATPVSIGCGTVPLTSSSIPTEPCPTTNTSSGPVSIFDPGTICSSPPGNLHNCYYGYEIYGYQCGTNTTDICVYSPQPTGVCPLPACLGINTPGSILCSTTSANLTQNYGITYVDAPDQTTCNAITSCASYCNAPCQYYCDTSNDYFVNSTGTACTQTRTFTVAPVPSYPSNSTTTVSNDVYFAPLCTDSNSPIANLNITNITNPGDTNCTDPGASPGYECQISHL